MIDRAKLMEIHKTTLEEITEEEKQGIIDFCETVIQPLLIKAAKVPEPCDIQISIPIRFEYNYGYKFIPMKPCIAKCTGRKYWVANYDYKFMKYNFFKEYLYEHGIGVDYEAADYECPNGSNYWFGANLIITVTM